LKSTETFSAAPGAVCHSNFSNFGSLKSTETSRIAHRTAVSFNFSNFGSLKSTETTDALQAAPAHRKISAISAR